MCTNQKNEGRLMDTISEYYEAKDREESAVIRINDSYLEALDALEKLEAENAKLQNDAELLREMLQAKRQETHALMAENAKLRDLVRDMFNGMCGYEHDCRCCEHFEMCEGQYFVGECEYNRRMRELGLEV